MRLNHIKSRKMSERKLASLLRLEAVDQGVALPERTFSREVNTIQLLRVNAVLLPSTRHWMATLSCSLDACSSF
jgi:predicted nuclease with RNAse H fold